MGRIAKGLLGKVIGAVGPISGSKWKHLAVLRQKSRRRFNPFTLKQIESRHKFGVLTKFMAGFKSLIRVGFLKHKKKGSQMNEAVHYNSSLHIVGDGPDFSIDYSRVVLSIGSLFRTTGAVLTAVPGKTLQLSWNNDEEHWSDQHQLVRGRDLLMLMAMHGDTEDPRLYKFLGKARREDLTISLRENWKDTSRRMHIWFFFVSEDGKQVSKSEYLSAMLLPG